RSQNIARPCAFPPPCNGGGRSRLWSRAEQLSCPRGAPRRVKAAGTPLRGRTRLTRIALIPRPRIPNSSQTEAAMPFRVSGKNMDVGEALRDRISDRIAETVSKYFDGGYSGHVTLARDGFGFRTECAIHLDSKITLHAEGA